MSLLLGWGIGQAVELGIVGIVIGSGLAGKRLPITSSLGGCICSHNGDHYYYITDYRICTAD